mgnify:CR=1 FL=1
MKQIFLYSLCFILFFAGTVKQNSIQIVEEGKLSYGLYDTLNYQGEKILLMNSPLQFTGHEYQLVTLNELPDDTSSPRVIISYVTEGGKLFISKVSVRGCVISNDTMKTRLERLTGSKMTKDGLFPINVSGVYIGRANAERFPSYYEKPYIIPGTGTVYKIELDKGKIVKMEDITNTEKNEKERLIKHFQSIEKG